MTTYATGDRRSRITVTTTLGITGSSHGVISNLLNGSDALDSAGSFFPDALSDNTGKEIVFTFADPVVIDEATFRQSGTHSRGNWRWQIWLSGAWANLGGAFALGGSAVQVLTSLDGNAVSSNKYRLLGMGGAVSDGGWIKEIEFKESGAVEPDPVEAYANPLIVPSSSFSSVQIFNSEYPMELVSEIPNVQYWTDPPPYIHVAKSRDILGCLTGDYIEAELVSEATWDFGPNPCEWAGMLMLRKVTDSGPVTLSNAGPTIDFRCMTENPGKNVLAEEHHAMMTLIGATTITEAGDYRVDYLTYVSTGNITASGHMKMHDGSMRAKRYRAA